jgi:hypothetical protein
MYPLETGLAEYRRDADFPARGFVNAESASRIARRVIGRSEQVGGSREMLDYVFFIVSAFGRQQDVDAEFAKVYGVVLAEPVTAGRSVGAGDRKIGPQFLTGVIQNFFYAINTRFADYLAYVQYSKSHATLRIFVLDTSAFAPTKSTRLRG